MLADELAGVERDAAEVDLLDVSRVPMGTTRWSGSGCIQASCPQISVRAQVVQREHQASESICERNGAGLRERLGDVVPARRAARPWFPHRWPQALAQEPGAMGS
eukprot:6552073-Pyramimonas_sp.AAC.1